MTGRDPPATPLPPALDDDEAPDKRFLPLPEDDTMSMQFATPPDSRQVSENPGRYDYDPSQGYGEDILLSRSRSPSIDSEDSEAVSLYTGAGFRQAPSVPTPGDDYSDPPPSEQSQLELPPPSGGSINILPFVVALFLLTWAGLD